MLDDLKLIHQRDAQDALGVAGKQWQQVQYDFKEHWQPSNPDFQLKSIVFAGMGGSALAATIVQSWPKTMVPFQIVHDYVLPCYAGTETLVIVSSYSGNTEETLALLRDAESRGCEIAVVAAGGELAARAEHKGYSLWRVPPGLQPRYAVLYCLAAVVQLLAPTGVIGGSSVVQELRDSGDWLRAQLADWQPEVPTARNQAKQIALDCIGQSIVIYSGPLLYPAAYKWKVGFNENAKQLAWCNAYPEFNHNEFIGWSRQPVDKPYAVIELRSHLEHPQIQKRFELSNRLLSGLRPDPTVVTAQGESLLKQLLWTIALGDFVTIYTAILSGINPTPVELTEKLKAKLA